MFAWSMRTTRSWGQTSSWSNGTLGRSGHGSSDGEYSELHWAVNIPPDQSLCCSPGDSPHTCVRAPCNYCDICLASDISCHFSC